MWSIILGIVAMIVASHFGASDTDAYLTGAVVALFSNALNSENHIGLLMERCERLEERFEAIEGDRLEREEED